MSATSGSRAARSQSSCSSTGHRAACGSEVSDTLDHTAASWPAGESAHRHLGQEHGEDGVLPGVEEGEEQALFRPEVGVDGSRGASGGLGHCVHRDGIDALVGEELGRGGQQPGPGLRLALVLVSSTCPPTSSALQPSYIGSVMQCGSVPTHGPHVSDPSTRRLPRPMAATGADAGSECGRGRRSSSTERATLAPDLQWNPSSDHTTRSREHHGHTETTRDSLYIDGAWVPSVGHRHRSRSSTRPPRRSWARCPRAPPRTSTAPWPRPGPPFRPGRPGRSPSAPPT